MPAIIEGPPAAGAPAAPLWKRLAWFAALALAGAGTTAAAAFLMRALLWR